jgi:pimeloyl-ACP methyl ester carboxylesterase
LHGAARTSPPDPRAAEGRLAFFSSQDSLRLAARIFDADSARRLPLLCLPGLSRNSRDFIPLGAYFSRHPIAPRKVVALDYRGRGRSDADPNWRNYTPLVEAQDVLTTGAALGLERAIVVGTSRGGILAMLLGAMRPGLLAGVVLNDIGPVVEGVGLARIKQYLGQRRAVRDWNDAIEAVKAAAGPQFPALGEDDWRAYAEATFTVTHSGIAPDFDPNLVRMVQDIDFSTKIPELWPQFTSLARVPLLAIRGERSDILSARTLAAMAEAHPRLEQLTVPGQGHAPLLSDAPSLERLAAFAARCDGLQSA